MIEKKIEGEIVVSACGFIACVIIILMLSSVLLIRAELTAVHSSVLQQELDSCRLLLEEEPDNKCEYAPEV